ncbi:MAG: glycosyltransferase, partial [Oscillospiraceae bacterium]|nr:glycosyltransferase [Oscillospiraceae bacterium]
MKKILLATMALDIGGAETHIVELAKELKRRGFDVIIASNGGVYVKEIEAAGIRHYTVPLNVRSVRPMISSYFMLKKIIKAERPDMVHAHARIPGFILGLVRRTVPFNFVTTAHWVFNT